MEKLGASNKKTKYISTLQRSAKERREAGVFIVEGIRMFREAPRYLIQEIYLTEEMISELKDEKYEAPVYVLEKSVFQKISDTQTPQGILTVLKRPEYSFEDLMGGINGKTDDVNKQSDELGHQDGCKKSSPLIVVLENLQDPGNLGTILRVGEAAGVTGIIMTKGTVDIYNPKVVRSTMGSIFRMPFIYDQQIELVMKELKSAGITTYAAHLQGSEIYTSYDYNAATAFLIGNEGNGLTDFATELAEKKLFIPMCGSVESLNAGIATSVLVYEAHRQRAL